MLYQFRKPGAVVVSTQRRERVSVSPAGVVQPVEEPPHFFVVRVQLRRDPPQVFRFFRVPGQGGAERLPIQFLGPFYFSLSVFFADPVQFFKGLREFGFVFDGGIQEVFGLVQVSVTGRLGPCRESDLRGGFPPEGDAPGRFRVTGVDEKQLFEFLNGGFVPSVLEQGLPFFEKGLHIGRPRR